MDEDPRQVSFFVWTAAWGKILTCDNLLKKGYMLVAWYCMYHQGRETMDHLFATFVLLCSIYGALTLDLLGFGGFYWKRLLIYCLNGMNKLASTCRTTGS